MVVRLVRATPKGVTQVPSQSGCKCHDFVCDEARTVGKDMTLVHENASAYDVDESRHVHERRAH